jgi:hypothetical protein
MALGRRLQVGDVLFDEGDVLERVHVATMRHPGGADIGTNTYIPAASLPKYVARHVLGI